MRRAGGQNGLFSEDETGCIIKYMVDTEKKQRVIDIQREERVGSVIREG